MHLSPDLRTQYLFQRTTNLGRWAARHSPQDQDTRGPHDEAEPPTHQETGRFTSADEAMQHEDGHGSDSTSLYQTAISLGRQARTSSRATNTNYDACGRTSNRLAPIMSHGSSSQAG